MDDQLLALRVFLRIVESGSFAKAADSLSVPRPTATRLIQRLEQHVGAKLLRRTTRSLSISDEGAAYYEAAKQLVVQLEELDAQVAGTRATIKGRLRVEVGSVLASNVILPRLHSLRERHPDLDLVLGVSDHPADLVEEGVDCALRGGPLPPSQLIARKLVDLDFVTCASPAYLDRRGRPAHPRDLERHDLVRYFASQTGRPEALKFTRLPAPDRAPRGDFDRPGQPEAIDALEALEVLGAAGVSVNESTAHLSALLAGLGIGQTFGFLVRPHLRRGELEVVLPEWSRERYPLHVVYPPNRYLSAKVRIFVDWLFELFTTLCRPDVRDETSACGLEAQERAVTSSSAALSSGSPPSADSPQQIPRGRKALPATTAA
jgi:LysR family transcriptional regulator, regulator for bpeEF and oprC